jgi:hypothetical protein
MNDVVAALQDLSGIMERLGLTYAVIGGIAVRAYGIPRPTYDVDFMLAIREIGWRSFTTRLKSVDIRFRRITKQVGWIPLPKCRW